MLPKHTIPGSLGLITIYSGLALVVAGNCPRVRPFEGGSLSGEYYRVEHPR